MIIDKSSQTISRHSFVKIILLRISIRKFDPWFEL
jgi:hypothetical protein